MAASASAPGKAILFGEHAVVYGRPALAAPVTQVRAVATVRAGPGEFWINAPDIGQSVRLAQAGPEDPLAVAVRLALKHARVTLAPPVVLRVESTIPIAAGLGSGAAACTAAVRALASYLGLEWTDAEVSALVFESEMLLHGTPSGIDNTVVAYGAPVYFVKGEPPVPLRVAAPFHLLIADTGWPSPTALAVADVRAGCERDPDRYARLFDEMGAISIEARAHIEGGTPERLGPLMNRNHALLRELDVSSPELERLVESALSAGAMGAKLSGGGRGGNMLALVEPETEPAVREALLRAGARGVIRSTVG